MSFTFGADVVSKFLNRHDLDLICRAHQVRNKFVGVNHQSLKLNFNIVQQIVIIHVIANNSDPKKLSEQKILFLDEIDCTTQNSFHSIDVSLLRKETR